MEKLSEGQESNGLMALTRVFFLPDMSYFVDSASFNSGS